jgi:flagellar basal body-associated protein FliL
MAEEKPKGKEEAAAKAPEATPEAAAKKAARKKMIVIAAVLAVDLVVMGGVALFIAMKLRAPNTAVEAQKTQEEDEKKRREEQTRIGVTLPKPLTYTVNIGGPGEEHYLKCSVQLEWEAMGPAKKGGGEGAEGGGAGDPLGQEIQKRMPKISDLIIGVLSSQSYQDLLKPSGKQKMKESIVGEVNAILPEEHGRLKNAYFTDFLVQ